MVDRMQAGKMFKIPISQKVISGMLLVNWSDGSTTKYDAVDMGVEWFGMSNDAFHATYGFNFNPHEWPGLYEKCRSIVYP